MNAAIESTDLDARSARRIFWISALSFVALTAILPPLCFPTFRSDVLEQIVIGREWVQGSSKHPALTTWIMQVFWVGLGGSRFAPSIAASACALVTMWAVWRLSREYVPEREALIATLCLTGYWYMGFGSAAMYNNNVTLITFWCLSILSLHFALRSGHPLSWVRTGVLLGAAVLCKYSAVVLVLSIGIFLVANADARRRLRTSGPWLALVAMALVVLPNAIFMLVELGGSYEYFERKRLKIGIMPFCLVLGRDWLIQLGIAAPILLAVVPLVGWRPRWARRLTNAGWSAAFVPAMFGLPIVIQTLLQCVVRVAYLQRSYGAPLWILAGLCAVYALETTADARRWRRAALLTSVLAAASLISLPVATATAYRWSSQSSARFFPGQALAQKVDAIWARGCSGPCRYIAGRHEEPLASWSVGVYSRHQPHVVDPQLGRWARDEDINVQGGVAIWLWNGADERGGVPADIADRFPRARLVESATLPYLMLNPAVPPLHVGIAVVDPRDDFHTAADERPAVR